MSTIKIHVLRQGLPICGFTQDAPSKWPEGHFWTSTRSAATCKACQHGPPSRQEEPDAEKLELRRALAALVMWAREREPTEPECEIVDAEHALAMTPEQAIALYRQNVDWAQGRFMERVAALLAVYERNDEPEGQLSARAVLLQIAALVERARKATP